jgi:hypothetical protein
MLFDSEKNRYRAFELEEHGFKYKGNSYSFDEIAHLFFSWTKTTHLLYGIKKAGQTESTYLHIILPSGVKIKLSFDELGYMWPYVAPDKKTDINNIVELFQVLSRLTFQKRANYYINQITERGYFIYDRCYFYPHKKIVFRSKEFFLENSRFLKGGGYVEMRPKSDGIAYKISRGLTMTKLPQFNTQTDPDVIFVLLDKYFSLRWN